MRRINKRFIAVLFIVMILVNNICYWPNIVSAQQVSESGYKIGIRYSEDFTSAVLKGDMTELNNGIEVVSLSDEKGNVFDYKDFNYTVSENGEYKFILTYKKLEDKEIVKEVKEEIEIKEEEIKEEILTVKVSEIGKKQNDISTNMPETVLLSDLIDYQKKIVDNEGIDVKAYSQHNNTEIEGRGFKFKGGSLVKGSDDIQKIDGWVFEKAGFVYGDSSSIIEISGLYQYEVDNGEGKEKVWFYTTENGAGRVNENVSLGYRLPGEAEVRFYYSSEELNRFKVIAEGNIKELEEWKITINGESVLKRSSENAESTINNEIFASVGERIIFEFTLPSKYRSGILNVKGIKGFDTSKVNGKDFEKVSEVRYRGFFKMIDKEIKISVQGTVWPQSEKRKFGVDTNLKIVQKEEKGYNHIRAVKIGERSVSMPFDRVAVLNSGGIREDRIGENGSGQYGESGNILELLYKSREGNFLKERTPIGQFVGGESIELETVITRYNEARSYAWKSYGLALDVYIGTEMTSNKFNQYLLNLPNKTGGRIVYDLEDIGVKVTIECSEYRIVDFWEQYNSMMKYKVVIEGMTHNFKIRTLEVSSVQENFVVSKMDGILEGKGDKNIITDGSSIHLMMNQAVDNIGEYPLVENTQFIGAEVFKEHGTSANHNEAAHKICKEYRDHIVLDIQPEYGYSKPSIELKNGEAEIIEDKIIEGNRKKYRYKLKPKGRIDDLKMGITEIELTSKPIEFTVKYTGSNLDGVEVGKWGVVENSYYAIKSTLPGVVKNKYFSHYKLYVKPVGANSAIEVEKGRENKWFPQDIVDMKVVYDQLMKKNALNNGERYEIEIRAIYTETNKGSLVKTNYEIYEQKDFIDNKIEEKEKYNVAKREIDGFQGTDIQLVAFDERYETGRKKYLFSSKHSRISGRVEEGKVFANLKYMLATTVRIDNASIEYVNNYEQWNNENQNKWFTSVQDENCILNLPEIRSEDMIKPSGEKFIGWKIQGRSGVVSSSNYNTKLNFNDLGRSDLAVWEDIFNSGEATLVAQWENPKPAEAYVSIPSRIQLTNDTSNVKKVSGITKTVTSYEKEKGYAGQKVTVKYIDTNNLLSKIALPNINVKVEDEVPMSRVEEVINNDIDMKISIYDTLGERIEGKIMPGSSKKYSDVGTLTSDNQSISFWMNVKQPKIYDDLSNKYEAFVSFSLSFAE